MFVSLGELTHKLSHFSDELISQEVELLGHPCFLLRIMVVEDEVLAPRDHDQSLVEVLVDVSLPCHLLEYPQVHVLEQDSGLVVLIETRLVLNDRFISLTNFYYTV